MRVSPRKGIGDIAMPNKNLRDFVKKNFASENLKNLGNRCALKCQDLRKFFKTIWEKMHAAFLGKFLGKSFALIDSLGKAPKSQNPKKIDTFTSTTYKILLLYLGTSVCFLGIISFMMYNKELHNLRNHQSMQMRNDFIQIATAMAQRDFKSSAGLEREIKKTLEEIEEKEAKLQKKNTTKNQAKLLKEIQKLQELQSLQVNQALQSQQNAQIPQDTAQRFHKSKEASPALLEFLREMRAEINSPFALLDENLGVVYSDLSVELDSISPIFASPQGFLRFEGFIFVNFSRNRGLLFHHPFGGGKIPKSAMKYLDKQGWIFILQGEAVESGTKIFSKDDARLEAQRFSQPKQIQSIKKEILSIRVEIIALMLLCLLVIAIVAYALVRLSLRPIKAQIKHLERFIKDTTHEVNTPLSVILMSVQKFDNSELGEANKKRLHHIKLSAQSLHQMYQNLIFLNFYQGKNNEQSLQLDSLINERVEYFSTLLAQKNITLDSRLSPAKIYANKDEITIMLDNLLSNAIKYNHKGGTISLLLTASQDKATLEVRDSGYGIQKEDLERIFERYKRFNDDKGGFGIGLSLVSEIASKYDIDLQVQSEVGKGSAFVLVFRTL